MTKRLIEEWLPIAELGIESVRERTPMTPFPAPNRLHVWWARRPLVASRAAVLASLLPADADRKTFMHMLGIHGDPIAAKKAMEKAKRTGIRIDNPYGYDRAFQHCPTEEEEFWLLEETQKLGIDNPTVLDPTAGGGAIPFEALRLGCKTLANDINPVAVLVQKATYEWPAKFGRSVLDEYNRLAPVFRQKLQERLADYFPQHKAPNELDCTYLWARAICCPYCAGKVPLSPNWKLTSDGTGVKLLPYLGTGPGDASRHCSFKVVNASHEQSHGTVKGGNATCPYPDCARVIEGSQIKDQALAGGMSEQLFAVVCKRRLPSEYTKTGKPKKDKWEREYRSPRDEDDISAAVKAALTLKLPEWEALDLVPSETLPMDTESWTHGNTPAQYGAQNFLQLFSPRQLLCHGTSMEIFRELVEEESKSPGGISPVRRAALAYIAFAIDRIIDWNSMQCTWEIGKLRMAHTFAVHAFPLKWSFAEMSSLVDGLGYEWTFRQTGKCIGELVSLLSPASELQSAVARPLFSESVSLAPEGKDAPVVVTCGSGDSLLHLGDDIVDAIVMDPPYYDNVMYAELSDFFYVWLRRSAGLIYPDLFASPLTDKENEAVANPARHEGKKGAKVLAGLDYQQKMSEIFAESRRVLRPDGVITLMFTHKATGAWDALTKGLIDAGFVITASWPIN